MYLPLLAGYFHVQHMYSGDIAVTIWQYPLDWVLNASGRILGQPLGIFTGGVLNTAISLSKDGPGRRNRLNAVLIPYAICGRGSIKCPEQSAARFCPTSYIFQNSCVVVATGYG